MYIYVITIISFCQVVPETWRARRFGNCRKCKNNIRLCFWLHDPRKVVTCPFAGNIRQCSPGVSGWFPHQGHTCVFLGDAPQAAGL